MKSKTAKLMLPLAATATFLLIVACGGSSGTSSTTPPSGPQAIVFNDPNNVSLSFNQLTGAAEVSWGPAQDKTPNATLYYYAAVFKQGAKIGSDAPVAMCPIQDSDKLTCTALPQQGSSSFQSGQSYFAVALAEDNAKPANRGISNASQLVVYTPPVGPQISFSGSPVFSEVPPDTGAFPPVAAANAVTWLDSANSIDPFLTLNYIVTVFNSNNQPVLSCASPIQARGDSDPNNKPSCQALNSPDSPLEFLPPGNYTVSVKAQAQTTNPSDPVPTPVSITTPYVATPATGTTILDFSAGGPFLTKDGQPIEVRASFTGDKLADYQCKEHSTNQSIDLTQGYSFLTSAGGSAHQGFQCTTAQGTGSATLTFWTAPTTGQPENLNCKVRVAWKVTANNTLSFIFIPQSDPYNGALQFEGDGCGAFTSNTGPSGSIDRVPGGQSSYQYNFSFNSGN